MSSPPEHSYVQKETNILSRIHCVSGTVLARHVIIWTAYIVLVIRARREPDFEDTNPSSAS